MNYDIRGVNETDLPFLRAMLFEAAYWRPGEPRPELDEGLADPELSKLLHGWGRAGDVGVLATVDGDPVGAAWYRLWTSDNHSYGYVSDDIPELAIGVASEWRGRGVGAKLLDALLATATENGIGELSLSVEKDNPALRLYERCGFRTVGELGNAWTMVAPTRREPPQP